MGVRDPLSHERMPSDGEGARTAMVTFIQRFGSKLNLNVHLHILALDGAYTFDHGKARFHRAPAPHPPVLCL